MIKKGIDLSYKVDPYGTEEIISSAANSCAPILTIDYGDEVQTDAEFTIRPTKGSLDTNISDVASINPIKGNTVAWNQQVPDNCINCTSATTDTRDSMYLVLQWYNNSYISTVYLTSTQGRHLRLMTAPANATTCYIKHNGVSRDIPLINVNNIKVVGNHKYIYINNIVGTDPTTIGGIVVNDNNFFDLTLIYGAGNEPSTVEAFEADYYKWFGKQLTYEPYSAGELRPVKMNGIKTTGANNSWVSVNPIPVTTLTGKLNGQGSSVVVFPDGMKKAGSVYDEIVKVNGVWKAIKRLDSIDLGTLTWASSSAGAFNTTLSPKKAGSHPMICAKYQYIANLGFAADDCISDTNASSYLQRIFIGDSTKASMSADDFKTSMSGELLYYELESPEEYILDAFDVQKLMLGANQVSKIYLGSDLIFEETN